ncbi:hypothetical protein PIB30_037190 [Stylosanthes scabra]|uniref:Uncharacterized protein n=1 Tax=Stylosanthes scabra TaxID=79078 RepID=A0ABU6WEK5_9FABA|nr:hypothetical protein [Stylosanthes scabra]
MIGQLNEFLLQGDVEPVVMIAQLFKPNYYLNETSIQSTYHSSRILFNSEYPEFIQFKESLMAKGDKASQCIAEIPTQSQFSVGSELASGSVTVETIESVLNMTQESECWVLGELVSIQAGSKD